MIAIKDMEMPSSCANCELCINGPYEELTCALTGEEWEETDYNSDYRDEKCPLVEIEQSEDCVSRKAVLECISIKNMPNANPSYWNICDVVDREDLKDCITDLPPVTPTHGTCKNCNKREDCLIDTDDDFYCRDWERRE